MESSKSPLLNLKYLVKLRQSLHQNPELAGNEEYTAEALKRTIIRFQPDDIIENLGGFGVAFVFRGKVDGPTILFRADMDALPIQETNTFDYASRTSGTAHQCGHDGHMAILVGVAEQISKNRPKMGRIVLLFQPAEETGEGALSIINDPNFSRIVPDFCFSMHNIPGFPQGNILLKANTFTAASQGLVVRLKGKTTHAAEPDKGISPAIAMARIIDNINELTEKKYLFSEFILATVVHAKLGERTFGTTPGHAEILIALRAYNDDDMSILIEHATNMINLVSNHQKLEVDIRYRDIYPITHNDPALTSLVTDMVKRKNMGWTKLTEPFHWAEDFSQFTQKYKSMMFGVGAGEDHVKLHNANYDFPDEIIPIAVQTYYDIYADYLLD